ncbi:MAG: adenine deaminase C-terminal domain-containing protein, partial [Rikenellaceae bacterium]
RNAEKSPIKIHFSIPSSVPSTPFDVVGSEISPSDVERMAKSGRFVALSEVMNVPGVLYDDESVDAKINAAREAGLPIDGHAPLLGGDDLKKYAGKGISTDHECTVMEEALEKISHGIKILIREGSAAANYANLSGLIASNPRDVMFCCDDVHLDDVFRRGHIDNIVRRAVADGYNLFDVLAIASKGAVEHYKLDVGLLREGDKADFIVVDNLTDFNTQRLYIDGELCYDASEPVKSVNQPFISLNFFNHEPISIEDIANVVSSTIPIVELIEDEIVTRRGDYTPSVAVSNLESDSESDLAKLVYINRYTNGRPQVAYCRGFGLKRGAFASTIAHDSHNIVAVGMSDAELTEAINGVIAQHGALSVAYDGVVESLPLPIAGIMSDCKGEEVAAKYEHLTSIIKALGSPLHAPFMTLSFLSLVVIPDIKIGEKGLFDYSSFNWLES